MITLYYCPKDQNLLIISGTSIFTGKTFLFCTECKTVYPIRETIPESVFNKINKEKE